MPRKDPIDHQRAIRAYHRASAALRDLHRVEWEALRAQFRADEDEKGYERLVRLPSGPRNGQQWMVTPYRQATSADLADVAEIINGALDEPDLAAAVLDALTTAGFLFMRATAFDAPQSEGAAAGE